MCEPALYPSYITATDHLFNYFSGRLVLRPFGSSQTRWTFHWQCKISVLSHQSSTIHQYFFYRALVSRFFLRLRAAAEEPNETVGGQRTGPLITDPSTGFNTRHSIKWAHSQLDGEVDIDLDLRSDYIPSRQGRHGDPEGLTLGVGHERGTNSQGAMPLDELRRLRTSKRFVKWAMDLGLGLSFRTPSL
jgi:hypothetical protein